MVYAKKIRIVCTFILKLNIPIKTPFRQTYFFGKKKYKGSLFKGVFYLGEE